MAPPLEDWAREVALQELARIIRRFPFEDFDRDVRPRLTRLTRAQLSLVEDGLAAMLGLVEEKARSPRRSAPAPWLPD